MLALERMGPVAVGGPLIRSSREAIAEDWRRNGCEWGCQAKRPAKCENSQCMWLCSPFSSVLTRPNNATFFFLLPYQASVKVSFPSSPFVFSMMFEAFGFMQGDLAVQKIISATFGGAALAVLFACLIFSLLSSSLASDADL